MNQVLLEQSEGEPAILEMKLTPFMEKLFKGYPLFLEIEMLQGTKEILPNGLIKYTITVSDAQKKELILEFMLKVISQSNKACQN